MENFLKPKFMKLVDSKTIENENTAYFVLEKLERGYGHTLGTSLRRTILSSIPGVSPFAIEIKGVQHEFQAIPNLKEDAVELILNLKELILEVDENIIDTEEIYKLELVSKIGAVKAGEIKTPEGINIVNKDLLIAHSLKEKALDMIIYVAYSKGYKTFEENRFIVKEKMGNKINVIAIDSNYSPIVKVNYSVEDVNPGEKKVYERLKFEVETKGNIKPESVLSLAASILVNYYNSIFNLKEINMDTHFEDEIEIEEEDTQLSMNIESLNLSVRSENALKSANIFTVEQLIDRPISKLQEIKNLGEKSKTEIIQIIQDMGLSFKSE
ncbi:MAG: DNA-directed RNA polymerase subunit alpha [Candidatus Hepatoplasma vulgare]|nr:MAG: DNA-directed RNA polymerase subunit alpha [Candidatus Hepatoplasma sp.]